VSKQKEQHPLRPALREKEGELQAALDEVCVDPMVQTRTTDELIQIEETLAIASDAAKQAISIRKRIRADADAAPPLA
jgi:hypothetical protein